MNDCMKRMLVTAAVAGMCGFMPPSEAEELISGNLPIGESSAHPLYYLEETTEEERRGNSVVLYNVDSQTKTYSPQYFDFTLRGFNVSIEELLYGEQRNRGASTIVNIAFPYEEELLNFWSETACDWSGDYFEIFNAGDLQILSEEVNYAVNSNAIIQMLNSISGSTDDSPFSHIGLVGHNGYRMEFDGNDNVLNADISQSAFIGNVTIGNLTFNSLNGVYTAGDDILFNNLLMNGDITNSEFGGGTQFSSVEVLGDVSNSEFVGNRSGNATFVSSSIDGDVTNTTFLGNQIVFEDVYVGGNITEATFVGNNNILINSEVAGNIEYCLFAQNGNAEIGAGDGFIQSSSVGNIIGSVFSDSLSPIFSNSTIGDIIDTTFINNRQGVFADTNVSSIQGSKFIGNSATFGGAIAIPNNSGDSVIRDTEMADEMVTYGGNDSVLRDPDMADEVGNGTGGNQAAMSLLDDTNGANQGLLDDESGSMSDRMSEQIGGLNQIPSYNISQTLFRENTADQGGAIYNGGRIDGITESTFEGNSVGQAGGAIYNEDLVGYIGNITETVFESNTADQGGAIYNGGMIDGITESTFEGNSVGHAGGAIYNTGNISNINADFRDNHVGCRMSYSREEMIDIAISGDYKAFFTVNDGWDCYYTDKGNFSVDRDGCLVTEDGYIVQGWEAVDGNIDTNLMPLNIFIPHDATEISIKSDGRIYVTLPYENEQQLVGTIAVAQFVNPTGLKMVGDNLYQASINSGDAIIKDVASFGNYIGVQEGYGGAIDNESIIGNITGNITGNYVSAQNESRGGAIYNQGTIGDITGDITGNYVNSQNVSLGGAIFNTGAIGNITGNISENYAFSENGDAQGGAIYNTITANSFEWGSNYVAYSYDGVIGNIDGNITGNHAVSNNSSAYGGAIFIDTASLDSNAMQHALSTNLPKTRIYLENNETGEQELLGEYYSRYDVDRYNKEGVRFDIYNTQYAEEQYYSLDDWNNDPTLQEEIAANFISVDEVELVAKNPYAFNITGDISGNYVVSGYDEVIDEETGETQFVYTSDAAGGAIFLNRTNLGDINGNITGNWAKGLDSHGGAIYNEGITGNITGDISENYVFSENEAEGGAIYSLISVETDYSSVESRISYGTLGDIEGNIAGNHAVSNNSSAYGGAISVYGDGVDLGNMSQVMSAYIPKTTVKVWNDELGDYEVVGEYFKKIYVDNYNNGVRYTDNGYDDYVEYQSMEDFNNDTDFIAELESQYVPAFEVEAKNPYAFNITGDISGNYVKSGREYVDEETGETYFESASEAKGGAIYLYNACLGDISGNITGNWAKGNVSQGGAIWNGNPIRDNSYITIAEDLIGNGLQQWQRVGNINGNISGNYVVAAYDATGGAIYNDGIVGNITGNISDNHAVSEMYAYGGAIGNNGIIGDITGDITGNYAEGRDSAVGGAIYNAQSSSDTSIGNITGNITGNHAASHDSSACGGAIYNVGAFIGDITGNISDNYADTNGYGAYGGAIYTEMNSHEQYGWDFYNQGAPQMYVYNGTIGTITGDITGNYVKGSDAQGGAIYVHSDIQYEHKENISNALPVYHVTVDGEDMGSYYNNQHLRCYNKGARFIDPGEYEISFTADEWEYEQQFFNENADDNRYFTPVADVELNGAENPWALRINGDITNNYAITGYGNNYGGAIWTNEDMVITGDIIGNYLKSDGGNTYGGAIYTESDMEISGDIIGNYLKSDGGNTHGGAIYTESDMEISGDIIGNYIRMNGGNAHGGAIATSGNLRLVADNKDMVIKDNYTINNGERDNNAIWVEDSDVTLTFDITNGGSISLYDNIKSDYGYNVNITGDGTGTFNLYNNMYSSNVVIDGVSTVNLANGEVFDYNFNSLVVAEGTNFLIDLDFTDANEWSQDIYADRIWVGDSPESSIITLSGINPINLNKEVLENRLINEGNALYVARVLDGNCSNIQLALSEALQAEELTLATINEQVVTGLTEVSEYSNNLQYWNDEINLYDRETVYTGHYQIETLSSENDSVAVTIHDITQNDTLVRKLDTLKTWTEQDSILNAEIYHTLFTENADDVLTVTEDLDHISEGNFRIESEYGSFGEAWDHNGEQELNLEQIPTIDADGHKLFTVLPFTQFTLSGVEIANAHSTDNGGALYVEAYQPQNIGGTAFTNNTTDQKGGAIYMDCGMMSIMNSVFDGNSAGQAGGAIYNAGKKFVGIDAALFIEGYNDARAYYVWEAGTPEKASDILSRNMYGRPFSNVEGYEDYYYNRIAHDRDYANQQEMAQVFGYNSLSEIDPLTAMFIMSNGNDHFDRPSEDRTPVDDYLGQYGYSSVQDFLDAFELDSLHDVKPIHLAMLHTDSRYYDDFAMSRGYDSMEELLAAYELDSVNDLTPEILYKLTGETLENYAERVIGEDWETYEEVDGGQIELYNVTLSNNYANGELNDITNEGVLLINGPVTSNSGISGGEIGGNVFLMSNEAPLNINNYLTGNYVVNNAGHGVGVTINLGSFEQHDGTVTHGYLDLLGINPYWPGASITINAANNYIENNNLGTATVFDENAIEWYENEGGLPKLYITADLDFDTMTSDTFAAAVDSCGVITLADINEMNLTELNPDGEYEFQILNTESETLTLELSDNILTYHPAVADKITTEVYGASQNMNWNDNVGTEQITTHYESQYVLRDNGILGIDIEETGSESISSNEDTLQAWAEQTGMSGVTRNFNFDSAENTYTYQGTGAITTSAGVLNVNGFYDDETGERSTIDANGQQLFNVGEGSTLNLSNVEVKNGFSANGSAIYNNGGTIGSISRSAFENNDNESLVSDVSAGGGAINNNGGTIGDITNSVFNNNDNSIYGMEHIQGGGAIFNYNGQMGDIVNSEFTNNSSAASGGAIAMVTDRKYNAEELYGFNHINIYVDGEFKGKYYLPETGDVINDGLRVRDEQGVDLKFTDYCMENVYFTAEEWEEHLETFADWYQDDPFEGIEELRAIQLTNDAVIGDIKNSVFTGNHSDFMGGAIYGIGNTIIGNIENSRFENNTAEEGGAILLREGVSVGDIVNTTFTNNSASAAGGAISFRELYQENVGDIVDSAFIGNHAVYDGGAIKISGRIKNIGADFTDNYLRMELSVDEGRGYAEGGAIFGDVYGDITGNFTNNYIYQQNQVQSYAAGGAIRAWIDGNISGNFTGNHIYQKNGEYYNYDSNAEGGAINGGIAGTITGDIKNNYIYQENLLQSSVSGGAIYGNVSGDIVGEISGNYIESNQGLYSDYIWAYGGAIKGSVSGTVTGDIKNNYIKIQEREYQGQAEVFGGAVFGAIEGGIKGDITGNYIEVTTGLLRDYTRALGGAISLENGNFGNIEGDITGNYIDITRGEDSFANNSYAYGGAIYLDWNSSMGDITGNISDNHIVSLLQAEGGAIANEGGTIGNISGDITGNYVLQTDTAEGAAFGGAIYSWGQISSIEGNISGNHAEGTFEIAGGAIWNGGQIGEITGDFSSNYIVAQKPNVWYGGGGAIFNNGGQIDELTGNFVSNYAQAIDNNAKGGAIFNDNGIIGTLAGNFVSNYAQSTNGDAQGGAIFDRGSYNYDTDNVINLESRHLFIDGEYKGTYYARWIQEELDNGAKLNPEYWYGYENIDTATWTAEDLENFYNDWNNDWTLQNPAEGRDDVWASYVAESESLPSVNGDFTGNYALSENGNAQGGAIYATGQPIYDGWASGLRIRHVYVDGEFVGDYYESEPAECFDLGMKIRENDIYESSEYLTSEEWENVRYDYENWMSTENPLDKYDNVLAHPGYAPSKFGTIKGNLINNYAKALNGTAQGGAIYTTGEVTLEADNAARLIQGNYTEDANGRDDNAIYLAGDNAKMTFDIKNGGQVSMYDNIRGEGDYQVVIQGADASFDTMNLYNNMYDANVTVNNVTMNLANDEAYAYSFNTLTTDNTSNWKLDLDFSNLSSDTITVANASTGSVVVSEVNALNFSNDIEAGEYRFQVLSSVDNNLQLALTDELADTVTILSSVGSQLVKGLKVNQKWNDAVGLYDHTSTKTGQYALGTTETENDSIVYNVVQTDSDVLNTKYDTLQKWATQSVASDVERNFGFDSANDVYTFSGTDTITPSAGTLNINGVYNSTSKKRSTINANGKQLFNVASGTTLNFENVEVKSAVSNGQGGAIYNEGVIDIVNTSFNGNKTNANSKSGGAIYNNGGTIASIKNSLFTSNTSKSDGGAIYNKGTIGKIENSTFKSNSAVYDGGAILNTWYGTIDSIVNSEFTSNSSGSIYFGAAINNHGIITNGITNSTFASNSGIHGVIYNNGTISSITDSMFKSNSGSSAIYNEKEIGSISGSSFISNKGNDGAAITNYDNNSGSNYSIGSIINSTFTSNSVTYSGGAIYNCGKITNGIINSTFTNNTAGTKGGAIYTYNDLSIVSNAGETLFQGNKANGISNAIYIGNKTGTLTFNQINNGVTNMYDAVAGNSGYKVKITGDSTGTMNLYNDLTGANVTVDKVTMNLANDETFAYNFNTLTSDNTANWAIDVDLTDSDNIVSDTINVSNSSAGSIVISEINSIGLNENTAVGAYNFQILHAADNNLKLVLADDVSGTEIVLSTTESQVEKGFNVNQHYGDVVGLYDRTTVLTGEYDLTTTQTENDTLVVNVVETTSDIINTQYDTLQYWATKEGVSDVERTFTFDSANNVYTSTGADAITTSAGALNINGVYNEEDDKRSTIDANGHSLFNVSKDTTLNLSNIEIKNVESTTYIGAIYNAGTIDSISNSVITAKSGDTCSTIANFGKIAEIKDSTFALNAGGAILNSQTIDEITNSTFKYNYAIRNGGAVYNAYTIENITGSEFALNTSYYSGGAIANTGTITDGIINSTFTSNIATQQGGAIYTNKDLSIVSNAGETLFQGNKANGISNAIYMDNKTGTLTFNQINNGVTNMYDAVAGSDGYSVAITGDSTGTMNLYNDLTGANVTVDNVTMNLANDEMFDYNFKTLTSDNTANWAIDVDFSDLSSDTINVANSSSGTILISTINALNLGNLNSDNTYDFRVLSAADNNLQLVLTEELRDTELVVSDKTITIDRDLADNVNWNDKFGVIEHTDSFVGSYNIKSTETTNDTLTVAITKTGESEVWSDSYDTLKAWSEQNTNEDRNFNFDASANEYKLTADLETVSAGVLNINGVADEVGNLSSINAQNHKLFTVTEATTLNITNTEIKNAVAPENGGAVDNNGILNLSNVAFTNNVAGETANDIHNTGALNIKDGTTLITGGVTGTGSTTVMGGNLVIADASNGLNQNTLNITSGSVKANAEKLNVASGSITNQGTLELTGGQNNNAVTGVGLIKVSGEVTNNKTINQKDFTVTSTGKLSGNLANINLSSNRIKNDGVINIADDSVVTLDITKDELGTGVININTESTTIGSRISDNTINLNHGELKFTDAANNIANANLTVNGCTLNLINDSTETLAMNTLTLNNDVEMLLDVDLANVSMDRISAQNYELNDHKINVLGMNLLSDSTGETTKIQFVDNNLKNNVVNQVNEVGAETSNAYQTAVYSPIYKYNVAYNTEENGGFYTFMRGSGKSSGDFNPAILDTPIMQQSQVMSVRNITNNYAFHHTDSCMDHNHGHMHISSKYDNRYALVDPIKSDMNTNNPLFVEPEHDTVWFKPYVTFENVPLKNGPKVNTISYGSMIGYDSNPIYHKHDWEGVWTAYIGYNGSDSHYAGVSNNSNGGLIGLTYSLFKGNFFNATTVTAGAMLDQASTMYGKDDITTLYAGIGNKMGYNFEFKDGRFVLQPSLLLSYTFANTFDYTNAAGVRINANPLNSLQISPGIKFYMNTKKGWQPYIGVSMMWDVMGRTDVKANNVNLPRMSVKPYVQYGVGIQKTVKDNFTAYGEAMVQNGGRNGVSLTFGFKWAIGKDKK